MHILKNANLDNRIDLKKNLIYCREKVNVQTIKQGYTFIELWTDPV